MVNILILEAMFNAKILLVKENPKELVFNNEILLYTALQKLKPLVLLCLVFLRKHTQILQNTEKSINCLRSMNGWLWASFIKKR